MVRFARRSLSLVAVVVLVLACVLPAIARADATVAKDDPFHGLKYRLLGPAWGGRVSRVTGVPGVPSVYYAAAASGGVWKSSDGGLHWQPIFDDQPISSIGSIAVAPSDPNVVYVGTGEANIRGNVAAGNGIYRSLDAGKTWTHVWKQEGQIGTMVVDPRSSDVAFAAVLGHAFGPNPERGVYRTKDGGKTWQQVLKKDEWTGASDVALDPSNPNIVFAGLWQARRRPWELTSGGPGSGLYVSHDGGDTWKQLSEHGLPKGIWGKVGVAVAPSDGRRVYALIEAEEGGLFRSEDGGESWTRISDSRELRQRPWYYSTMAVSPANPDEIWVPQVPLLRSIDGGKTFQHVHGEHHGDNHDVWFDPKDARRLIVGNDGGIDITTDGGETWLTPWLPIGQFYHVSADNSVPFRVAGALQDIGTAQAPVDSLHSAGIRNSDWWGVGGGEAGWVYSDPSDPQIVYAGEYSGYISRLDQRTGEQRNVSAYPDNDSGHGGEELLHRFQWTAPIVGSPHDPKVVYHAAEVLFRSRDGGQTWETISPDLTRNDKSKEKWSGGPITGDNTGVEVYCTIFAVAESPVEKGLIWAGSDDGLVHVTRDDGKTWQDVTGNVPGIPEWGTVSMIEPSHFAAGTAYLVVDAHRLDDMRPYLWKTADFGRTWKRLGDGLAKDVYLHAVREEPTRAGVLYLGTERGVEVSFDDGATWRPLKLNLPTVAVHDLVAKDRSLVLATHGRSMWILDDRMPLLEATPPAAETARLLPIPDTTAWVVRGGRSLGQWSAANPPHGVRLTYWLKEAPKDDITLEILDAQGHSVRRLSSKPPEPIHTSEYADEEKEALDKLAIPKAAGLNLATWDLDWTGAELIPGAMIDSGDPYFGPAAVPGTYTARLTVAGKSYEQSFRVLPDPRLAVDPQALAQQLALALEVRDQISRLTRGVLELRSVRQQLQARSELLKDDTRTAALRKSSADLVGKLDALEEQLHNPKAQVIYDILAFKGGAKLYSRLAPTLEFLKEGRGAPVQGVREEYAREKAELDKLLGDLDGLVKGDLATLNQQARSLGVPEVYVAAGR